MTALPTDWLYPPPDGWTPADLERQLEATLPQGWQLETDIDVMLDGDPLDYLTPDVVVFRADVPLVTRPVQAADIVLVVEVVSRGSRREDRGAKPLAYAEAGIGWYRRLESLLSGAEVPWLHVHRLEPGDPERRQYRETGRHHALCSPDGPFAATLDLDRLT